MAEPRKYLLDANILIEAHKRYYSLDLCPGFWEAVVRQHRANRIFSIDRVKKEIDDGKDLLTEWMQQEAPDTLFKRTDIAAVVGQFGKMVAWVQGESQYKQEAKAEFATVADGWLIACAKTEGLIVVSEEMYNRDVKKKVPIPNVCRQFDVEYINTFDMLRELKIQFVERLDIKTTESTA
jgi:hypothetical protein